MAFALCVVGDAKIGSPIYGVLLSCAGGVLDPLLFFILFSVTLFLLLPPATMWTDELILRLRFANLLTAHRTLHCAHSIPRKINSARLTSYPCWSSGGPTSESTRVRDDSAPALGIQRGYLVTFRATNLGAPTSFALAGIVLRRSPRRGLIFGAPRWDLHHTSLTAGNRSLACHDPSVRCRVLYY